MNKNDPVTIALKIILGRKRQAPDYASHKQQYTACQQPGHEPGGYPEKPLWGTQFVKNLPHQMVTALPFTLFYPFDKLIFSAAAAANGASVSASIRKAPIKARYAPTDAPSAAAATVPVPNISTGMYRGMINRDKSTPADRNPSVNAAPIAPIKLSTGVPINSVRHKTAIEFPSRCTITPRTGAKITKGKPVSIQCAVVLAKIRRNNGCG